MKSLSLLAIAAFSSVLMSFNAIPGVMYTALYEYDYNYAPTAIVWKSEEIDLGKIPQGKPVTVKFQLTNTGSDPVIITSVSTSCGCTVADYPKQPIKANEKAEITATYNAASPGVFTKAVTVTFSTNESKILNLKGTVVQ